MKTVAVIGAGTMGAGIAQLAATQGCTVYLNDTDTTIVEEAIKRIVGNLDRMVEKGGVSKADRDTALSRIMPLESAQGFDDAELVIEAVTEDEAVKRNVFKALDEVTSSSAVLASNTSSLSITRIAEAVKTPSRVIGMHFFNPVPIMPLVEVVVGEKSHESCINLAFDTARSWGKVAVRAKDTPGFIVNRVGRGFYLEALRLLGEGVAGVDEIDAVMRLHGKFRMGPFELMDLIGLDVNLNATTSIWERLGKPARFAPHEIQRGLVERGYLGRKSGRGFYLYDAGTTLPACMVDRRSFELTPLMADAMWVFAVRAGADNPGSTEQYILSRILAAVINEAGIVFSEGVAASDDIDIAMVKGMNYPTGPLAWADDIGHRTVRGMLKALNETAGDRRYAPAALFAGAT